MGPKWGKFVIAGENFLDGLGVLLTAALRVLRILVEIVVWAAFAIAGVVLCLTLIGHGPPTTSPSMHVGDLRVPPLIYTAILGGLTSSPRLFTWFRRRLQGQPLRSRDRKTPND